MTRRQSDRRGSIRIAVRLSLAILATSAPGMMVACGLILNLPDPSDRGDGGSGNSTRPSMGGKSGSKTESLEPSEGGRPATTGSDPSGGSSDGGAEGGGSAVVTHKPVEEVEIAGAFSTDDGPVEEGACDNPCDCDKDGEESTACGGNDCDDLDGRVFSGQTEYFVSRAPDDKVGFDYNCNGKLDSNPFQDAAISCSLLLTCEGEGYIDEKPACGTSGTWGKCETKALIGCVAVTLDTEYKMKCH